MHPPKTCCAAASYDGRYGSANENEPWLAFWARKNPRNPYLAAVREAGARIGALEKRVASLAAARWRAASSTSGVQDSDPVFASECCYGAAWD